MPARDVVVIGSGATGGVLAARLAQDGSRRVLLLEAGPDFADVAAMPNALRRADAPDAATGYDWELQATICDGRRGPLTRGKVIGGSTQVNGAGAVRATPRDFAEWSARGLPEWAWERVLTSYCDLEHDLEFGDAPYHGATGPLPITRGSGDYGAAMQGFIDATLAAGHAWSADMNAPGATGIGPYPSNQRDRVRMSTTVAFLEAARDHPNLEIRADTTVDRIVLDGKRAVGVAAGGDVLPAAEIVVCAGTPLSPALLLRSGIGPAGDLTRLGLAVAVDLPGVGAGFIDQPGAVIPAVPRIGAGAHDDPLRRVIARLPQVPGHPDDDAFYLCLFTGPPPGGGPPLSALMVGDMAMASRGSVTLASADPAVPPQVDCAFYSAPGDLDRMIAMYRHAWEIANHTAFSATVDRFEWIDDALIADDERLAAALRGMTFSRINPVGGCAMGPSSDPAAVVDAHGRVHGVEGLRVADASILPVPLRAPAALTCMMIGEHLATLMMSE
jgi:choline dehydrogenase